MKRTSPFGHDEIIDLRFSVEGYIILVHPLAITITIALNYPLFKLLPYDVAILSNNYYMNNVLYDISLNKYNSNYFNNLNIYNNNLSFVTSNM